MLCGIFLKNYSFVSEADATRITAYTSEKQSYNSGIRGKGKIKEREQVRLPGLFIIFVVRVL